jgi:hypothetical protein
LKKPSRDIRGGFCYLTWVYIGIGIRKAETASWANVLEFQLSGYCRSAGALHFAPALGASL